MCRQYKHIVSVDTHVCRTLCALRNNIFSSLQQAIYGTFILPAQGNLINVIFVARGPDLR